MRLALAALTLLAAPRAPAAAGPVTVVACAPGHPGSTAEAQPHMDAFAAALASAAGWPAGRLAAVYHETERGGLERLAREDAALALVPLPFLLRHGGELGLEPRLQVREKGGGLSQTWSLVAAKGRVAGPASLRGFTVVSLAGYAPAFVRGALGGWGRIPESARVVHSGQVLSALRRAAGGEPVALLLDAAQAAALSTLPFAADLEVVARSEPLPVAFVCTLRGRLDRSRREALLAALARLPSDPAGAAALEGIRMAGFAPVGTPGLERARRLASGKAR